MGKELGLFGLLVSASCVALCPVEMEIGAYPHLRDVYVTFLKILQGCYSETVLSNRHLLKWDCMLQTILKNVILIGQAYARRMLEVVCDTY